LFDGLQSTGSIEGPRDTNWFTGANGGGFSRGLINQSGDGVATHALSMVRPATGR
jgi:hypothetical protein